MAPPELTAKVSPPFFWQSPHCPRTHSTVFPNPPPAFQTLPILTRQGEQGKASLQFWGEGLGKRDPEEGAGAASLDFPECSLLSAKVQNYPLPQFPPLPPFGFCVQEPCLAAVQRGEWRDDKVRWKAQDRGGLSRQHWGDYARHPTRDTAPELCLPEPWCGA